VVFQGSSSDILEVVPSAEPWPERAVVVAGRGFLGGLSWGVICSALVADGVGNCWMYDRVY
jgi:hypothetical protein